MARLSRATAVTAATEGPHRNHLHLGAESGMEHPRYWSHETTLLSQRTSARAARTFVRAHLLKHQQTALIDDVRVVASELAEMLISHDGHGSFNVSLRGGGGEVLLLMQDGVAGSVESVLGTGKPDRGDPHLRLTEKLSERWGLAMTPAGAVVWASFASCGAGVRTAREHVV